MPLSVGDIVQNKYRIVRLIGEGGMGAVYEGENTLIARRVAIKVLHGSAAVNPDIVQRFQREAQAAGRIGNDHILEVLDLGTLADGDLFMVMEYLDGENLADRIDRMQRLTPQQVYPLVRQMLEGLGAAHGAGIIHRDLKPENIFILREKAGYRDFVKIIDFGISKFNVLDGDSGNMAMTATGAVMGTPYYMAPEQAKGSKVADPRSDIYAVGVIMYKAITGDEPFSAETFNELLFKIVLSDLVPAKQLVTDLDDAFDTIISKAMAKDPNHRFTSCEAMIAALDAWAHSGKSVTVPPPVPEDPRVAAGLAPSPQPSVDAAVEPGPNLSGASGSAAGPSQSDASVAAPAGMGRQTPGAQTPGSWANQSGTETLPKKSILPLIAAAAAFALLLLVVGAVGLYKLTSSDQKPELSGETQAATEGEPGQEQAGLAPSQQPSPAEPASEPESKDEPTESDAAQQPPAATDAGDKQPEGDKPAAQPRSKPTAARPAPRAPRPRPRPRKTPDFGY